MISQNTQISDSFRKQTYKAIGSIVLFCMVYFTLLLSSILLTIGAVFVGISLITTKPSFITIIVGAGIVIPSVLIFLFIIKFIFKTNKKDMSSLIEITEKDQPKLFQMIHEIVGKVGTSLPKKVYFAPDVTAAVFYNSSFWSMFLPVKKNLVIGMGLIESLSEAELKSVLSHEFGHFSQGSMKLGSYVYNVNQIIFNLVSPDETFNEALNKVANISIVISLFVILAHHIIEKIKWILGQMYNLVNKSYMGLSREMEFHADEIAAQITGYEPIEASLYRIDFMDSIFHATLNFYDANLEKNYASKNVYENIRKAVYFHAEKNDLKFENDLPMIDHSILNKFNKSKLHIENQWASHPSNADRVQNLKEKGLNHTLPLHDRASNLIQNLAQYQEELTARIFQNAPFTEKPIYLNIVDFEEKFREQYEKNTFPDEYNCYYDDYNIPLFDLDNYEGNSYVFEDFFTSEQVNDVYNYVALVNDLEAINQIKNEDTGIKTFDYNGKKVFANDSVALIQSLRNEKDKYEEQLKNNDRKIYQFFLHQETLQNKTPKLKQLYLKLLGYDQEFDERNQALMNFTNKLEFIAEVTPVEKINANFSSMHKEEKAFKEAINNVLNDEQFQTEITEEIRENLEKYTSKNWKYFRNESYIDSNLEMLTKATHQYAYLISRLYFIHKKNVLNYQLSLIQ